MRQVVCHRPEWREEKVPCVVRTVHWRREVTPVKTQVMVPKLVDQVVRTAYYTPVPREVEREVTRCVLVPVVITDPCTGCSFTTCCPQWIRERVRCVEYDVRKDERDVNVKVCKWFPEDRVFDQVRFIPEVRETQSWTVRRYCVMVPHQTTVCVPVYRWCCWP
jgi:hypothetical protein